MNIKRLNTVLCLSAVCVVSSSIAVAKDLAMSENNVQECTKLLNKVAQTDEAILKNMQARQIKATQNAAVFADNNAAQPIVPNEKTTVTAPTVATVATPAPAPVQQASSETQTAPLPKDTQIFASSDPEDIAHLTGKNTAPLMATPDPVLPKTSAKPFKTSATKSTKKISHPHIELSAPSNTHKTDDSKTLSKSEKLSNESIKSSI